MSPKLTIAIDVDEVCAALIPEWIRRYNVEYDDNLTADEIDRWELSELVLCGTDIFKYLHEPDLYDHVQPIPGARPAVYELLGMGHRIIYVSSCPRGTIEQKREWLLRWSFLSNKNADKDFVPCSDKSLIKADYLFDDRLENVRTFSGTGVLVRQPHNRLASFPDCVRGLYEAPSFIRRRTSIY